MAEALFYHGIKRRPALARLTVESAGTIAYDGYPANADAAALIQEEYGLDISAHRRLHVLVEERLEPRLVGETDDRLDDFTTLEE